MSNIPLTIPYGKRIVRLVMMNGLPKFCATDICDILGYVNPNKTLGRFCDSTPEYVKMNTAGEPQNFRMIGTDDVRAILARSRRRNVGRLKKWFEEKVVPAFTFNTIGVVVVCPLGDYTK